MISLSVVHWLMLENGWTFADGPGVLKDPLQGAQFLHEIYTRADPTYTGRVTVPVLWDKATDTLVSNEFLRDHPDAEQRLRQHRCISGRLLSRSAAA